MSKTITIEGTFTGPINNHVIVKVYQSLTDPDSYFFTDEYETDFSETLDDLAAGEIYYVDFSGHTTSEFTFVIGGEFEDPNPLTDTFENRHFSSMNTIKTTN